MNTSQVMDQWQVHFDRPTGGRLGIIVAILDIGSLCSFWMVSVNPIERGLSAIRLADHDSNLHRPFFADTYGRKTPIIIGCVVEAIGAFIGAFSNGYASMTSQV